MSEDWQEVGFGLYIHWPFCAAKCPYCDFNSHVVRQIDQHRWLRAYVSEIERVSAETPERVLNSVFFGGGTPSLMAPEIVGGILDAVRDAWRVANDIEITLEANPSSTEAGRFAGYRDAGVNRVSMGVQALNDRDLTRLGRLHSVAEARAAFAIARDCFDRVSFDLIYTRQDQTLEAWGNELRTALDMAVDHLSLYQLTIEDGTAFGDRYKVGTLRGLPDEDLARAMYDITQEICDVHGLPAYEVSNHARPGAQSRHNLIYWAYGDYAGIGPGAHGRLTMDGQKWATETPLAPGDWLGRAEAGLGEIHRQALTAGDQASEYLMMGLRLTQQLDIVRYDRFADQPLPRDRIQHLTDLGLLQSTDTTIQATDKGRVLLNAVIRALLIP